MSHSDQSDTVTVGEAMSTQVLGYCNVVSDAWDLINGLRVQIKGMPVAVTDPIAAACAELGRAQDALEHQLGHWTRIERQAPR